MDAFHDGAATVLTVTLDEAARALTIELDDGSSFTVAPDAPEARGLTPGLSVAPELHEALRTADDRKRIAKRVFGWLDRRPRCRADLRRRLLERGHDERAIDTVLERFQEQGLVDDRAFAHAWVEQAMRRRPVGRRWLWSKLRQQGVDDEIAREAVDAALEGDDELEAARRALAKRRLDLDDRRQREKALRFLQQRGFASAIAARVLRERSVEGTHDPGDGLA